MSWDNLVSRMTHTNEGGWSGFKDAVERVTPQDEDPADAAKHLRLHFSEFGDADFFIGGSRRWRMRPPVLAILAGHPEEAILSGGRTGTLINRIGRAGRRGLGMSAALTLCRGRSHDDYYFERPKMIVSDPPPRPYVDVTREEIARRVVVKEVLRRAFQAIVLGDVVRVVHGQVNGDGTPPVVRMDRISTSFWTVA